MAVAFFLAFASQLPVLRGMSKEVESIIVCFNNRETIPKVQQLLYLQLPSLSLAPPPPSSTSLRINSRLLSFYFDSVEDHWRRIIAGKWFQNLQLRYIWEVTETNPKQFVILRINYLIIQLLISIIVQ